MIKNRSNNLLNGKVNVPGRRKIKVDTIHETFHNALYPSYTSAKLLGLQED